MSKLTAAALTKSDLDRLWSLDHIGITDSIDDSLTIDQQRAVDMMKKGLYFRDGCYYAPMLWAKPNVTMDTNWNRALKRDEGNNARFAKPGMEVKKESFIEAVHKFVKLGHAQKMTKEQLAMPSDGPVRYLSLQAVFKDGDPRNCRPVFDASERTHDGKSLNNQLLPGPSVLRDLVEIMLRFRSRAVALVGDIKGMFLAIKLAEGKDSHRFIWRDLDPTREPEVYRLCTVTFGVADSPFKACYVVTFHAEENKVEFPLAFASINEDTYMDDALSGSQSPEEAKLLFDQLFHMLGKGGFKFAKVMSNDPEVMKHVPEELRAPLSRRTLDSAGVEENMHSALGTSWDPKSDQLYFRFAHKFEPIAKETKRTLVSQGSKVYDPTGLISPFTLEARKLMRECCDRELDWGDKLPEDLRAKLAKWRDQVEDLAEVTVPRCVVPKDTEEIQLHFFSDASATAYGSVAYVRTISPSGQIRAHLLMSKNRLAPKDQLNKKIPRLELLGALLSIRLFKYVSKALKCPISRVCFWTDSSIALAWIRKNPGHLKPFCGNRTKEIQAHSSVDQWFHLPGEYNISADICSRGCTAIELSKLKEWWSGPSILYWEDTKWLTDLPMAPRFTEEQVAILKAEEKLPATFATRARVYPKLRQEIVIARRKWRRGLNVLALVERAVRKFKNILAKSKNREANMHAIPVGPITAGELEEATVNLVKEVQNEQFPREIASLQETVPIDSNSKLKNLNPGLDDKGQLVMQGRLLLSEKLNIEAKMPVILPANHPVTERAILHAHEQARHAGVHQTLYLVRYRFWTLGGHRYAKSVLGKCQFCRLRKAKPLKQQLAPLPPERLDNSPPFSSIGVDFAGPFYTYENPGEAARKAYVAVFTCMSTRGVHLELVPSLETQTFVAAFRRMIGRRGWPKTVFSDSALTFKRAAKDLMLRYQSLDWAQIMQEVNPGFSGIEWSFNCPKSPWWGGTFERMVGLMKERLNLSLKSSKLSFLALTTVLIETESVINSRPLASLRTDPAAPTPITPGHLIAGRMLMIIPDANVKNVPELEVLEKLRHQQALSRQFWRSFSQDYLQELQIRKKWTDVSDYSQLEGKVVVVREESIGKKCYWPLGVIIHAIPGRDGLIRSCEVRLANGKQIRRPVQKLALIDSYEYKDDESK